MTALITGALSWTPVLRVGFYPLLPRPTYLVIAAALAECLAIAVTATGLRPRRHLR